jgi:hypothetical protein
MLVEVVVKGKSFDAADLVDLLEHVDAAFNLLAEHGEAAMRQYLASKRKNPVPWMPGGSMRSCIEEMETRPGVRDPGALCKYLEIGGGLGPRAPGRRRTKPLKRDAKKLLRAAIRGRR